jgi:putative ABC transport system ATP-binding protein
MFRRKPLVPPTPANYSGPIIRLSSLGKHVTTKAGRMNILNNIQLDIAKGEFISIMGPSGAGKSTLLSILGMLDHDWTGSYELMGHSVNALSLDSRRELAKAQIGFVFQQYHLLDDLTVYENLEIPLSYRDVPKSERAAIVADTLDRFHMVGKKDLYPNQLSGGQQQMVGVARAMIAKPSIILADEPTGSLHSSQGKVIMELLANLNRAGTTIVQVTHSEENAGYGNRTIELWDGWLTKSSDAQKGAAASAVQG